jgi:hypothetical protein
MNLLLSVSKILPQIEQGICGIAEIHGWRAVGSRQLVIENRLPVGHRNLLSYA